LGDKQLFEAREQERNRRRTPKIKGTSSKLSRKTLPHQPGIATRGKSSTEDRERVGRVTFAWGEPDKKTDSRQNFQLRDRKKKETFLDTGRSADWRLPVPVWQGWLANHGYDRQGMTEARQENMRKSAKIAQRTGKTVEKEPRAQKTVQNRA